MRILKEIDTYLEDRDYENEASKVRKSHHPSEVSACNRAIYYRWTKAPITNPRNAESIWRMEMGKAVELLAVGYLKGMGYEVIEQEEVTIEASPLIHPVHGYIDITIQTVDGLHRAEVKTTWGQGTKAIQYNGPQKEHVEQAMCYMIDKGINVYNMIYIARDTLWRSEFVIKKTQWELDNFRAHMISKFAHIESCVDEKVMPPRDFSAIVADGEVKATIQRNGVKYKSDWNCLYCVRRDLCYANERESFGLYLPEVRG